MRFRDYLADRALFMIVYCCGVFLALLTVWLEFAAGGLEVQRSALVYAMVLSVVLGASALVFDYRRSFEFLRQIERALDSGCSVEDIVSIRDPVSRQDKVFTRILQDLGRRHLDELAHFRRNEEFRQHLADRWVHHMKTPVSVIELLVQQGEDAAALETAKGLLSSIGQENRRLTERLGLFLNSVRMDRFEKDLRIESVDVLQLCRDVLNSHKKELIRYSIFPKIQCQTRELWVPTDRKWLKFVIEQIVSNAIKYTRIKIPDRGGRSLEVHAQVEGNSCMLRIEDHGVGIPPEDIPRVFDPFFTGYNGRLVPESTGMGLYLARRVISSLGHRISIESRVGEGTAVTVTFLSGSVIEGAIERSEGPWPVGKAHPTNS